MDILYIIGEGSKTSNFELRQSLRSIEMYGGSSVDRVFIAGYIPAWIDTENVIAVPYDQPFSAMAEAAHGQPNPCSHRNILSTIIHVCESTDISEEFLFSSDDHFYIDFVNFNSYPIYRKNRRSFDPPYQLPRWDDPGMRISRSYSTKLAHTRDFLECHGLPYNFFTLHRNMHCWKSDILELKDTLLADVLSNDGDLEPFCVLLNYRYASCPFSFVDVRDDKVKAPMPISEIRSRTECFSTPPFALFSPLYWMLKTMYPNKSKYEK